MVMSVEIESVPVAIEAEVIEIFLQVEPCSRLWWYKRIVSILSFVELSLIRKVETVNQQLTIMTAVISGQELLPRGNRSNEEGHQ